MSEITTIEERILAYYNDLIKNNVISGQAPVTLEWLRRQRIVEGRSELDIRFGHVVVDSVLGEKTPLAKAEHYLVAVRKYGKYELLPEIARLLAKECTTMLQSDDPIRIKYSSLNRSIPIPAIELKGVEITLSSLLNISKKQITIEGLKNLNSYFSTNALNVNPFELCFFEYLQKITYFSLVNCFKEIKETVEAITK